MLVFLVAGLPVHEALWSVRGLHMVRFEGRVSCLSHRVPFELAEELMAYSRYEDVVNPLNLKLEMSVSSNPRKEP